jgi:branched-chain amino acid transport system permease protein
VITGAIAGIAIIYLGAVGMIEQFNIRNLISNVVTLGRLMLVLPAFLAGYLVVRPHVRRGEVERPAPRAGLLAGVAAGAATGIVVVAFLALFHVIGTDAVNGIFLSISEGLLTIIQFGKTMPVATVILILGGAALGFAGAGFHLLPQRYRRPLAAGLFATFLFALLQRIIPPALFQLGMDTTWLYSAFFFGLTWLGAAIIFGVSAAAAFWWDRSKEPVRERMRSMSDRGQKSVKGVGFLVILAFLSVIPLLVGEDLSQVLGQVAIFLLMALGLNIVVGFAGLLDLGYVAFFAVGAYVTAILTGGRLVESLGGSTPPALHASFSFYEALPFVILIAAFIGLLIGAPVLRLRGDYLAIVTLGFGEIARILVTSDWLKPVVGGAQGMTNLTDASLFGISFRSFKAFYYLALVFCLIALFLSRRLADSRIGRAWSAMREDEQVAEAMGVSTVKYKLLAFAIGASVGCVGGALFTVQIGSLTSQSFTILVSITVLAVIILGGMGSIPGVVVGAILLIGIPNLLSEFEQFKLLIYGATLIAIMALRPQGVIPNVRRAMELHDEERDQDAWLKRTGDASVEPGVAVGAKEPE